MSHAPRAIGTGVQGSDAGLLETLHELSRGAGMHELSIAVSLVESACDQLPQLGDGARIAALHVRIGPLAGVVTEALRFSFDVAAAGTAIEGARLEIEEVALTAWCDRCGGERRLVSMQLLQCPDCGAPTPRILTGRELELAALEVFDDGPNR